MPILLVFCWCQSPLLSDFDEFFNKLAALLYQYLDPQTVGTIPTEITWVKILVDQRDLNEAREEQQDKRIAKMTQQLAELRASTQLKQELNNQADATILKVLKGIDELVKYDDYKLII